MRAKLTSLPSIIIDQYPSQYQIRLEANPHEFQNTNKKLSKLSFHNLQHQDAS